MEKEIGVSITSVTASEIDDASEKENLRKLEAVFFISGKFLNMQEIVSLTDLNPIILKELIEKLKEKYDESDSAMEIITKGKGSGELWKMDVRPEYSEIVNRLATGSSEFSKAEQETLAIIAFKQPIKQSVVIKIRGNKGYDHIKKFAQLGLLKKKREGHTHVLSLADDFYDYFSVKDAREDSEESNGEENVPDRDEVVKEGDV